ncbi:hypothetical protein ACFE04_008822 [Oxalis oulophora]
MADDDNACVGVKPATIIQVEEDNKNHQQQEKECKDSIFPIVSSSKDDHQTSPNNKVNSSPLRYLSNNGIIRQLGIDHQVGLVVSVPEISSQEMLDTVNQIVEILGTQFKECHDEGGSKACLEQNQQMVDAVCKKEGTLCELVKETDVFQGAFEADIEKKEKANGFIEVSQSQGGFESDIEKKEKRRSFVEVCLGSFEADFEKKDKADSVVDRGNVNGKGLPGVQDLKKIHESKNHVGVVKMPFFMNGRIGKKQSKGEWIKVPDILEAKNKKLSSQTEIGSDKTGVKKVTGFANASHSAIYRKGNEFHKVFKVADFANASLSAIDGKENRFPEIFKKVQNEADKHDSSSLKYKVIDDTALIEMIPLPKKSGNKHVRGPGGIKFAKGRERTIKKNDKQEVDGINFTKAKGMTIKKNENQEADSINFTKAKGMTIEKNDKQEDNGNRSNQSRNKTRVPKRSETNQGHQNLRVYRKVVKITKKIYSREKMEALRYVGVDDQQKLWTSLYNGLAPEVIKEYDTLVATKQPKNVFSNYYAQQQKNVCSNFYPQQQFHKRGQLPGLLGAFAGGRGSDIQSNISDEISSCECDQCLPLLRLGYG